MSGSEMTERPVGNAKEKEEEEASKQGDDGRLTSGFYRDPLPEPVCSDCRELVLVSGGWSTQLLELQNKYPDICWEYPSTELLISYQYRVLCPDTDPRVPVKDAPDPVDAEFYAYVSFLVSQPKSIVASADRISEILSDYYSLNEKDISTLKGDQVFVGAPCVIRRPTKQGDGDWVRGQIISIPPPSPFADVPSLIRIRLVDWGDEMFLGDMEALKPLFSRFARLPPLALHCRIDKVETRYLETHIVEEFHELMSKLDYFLKVRIISMDQRPLRVEIFHPTLLSYNLGEKYKAPPEKFKTYKDDDSFDRVTSDEEEEREKPPWVLRYPRMMKPQKTMESLKTSHVENCRSIYIQTEENMTRTEELEKRLSLHFRAHPPHTLPVSLLEVGVACAVSKGGEEGSWCRGIVRRVVGGGEGMEVVVQSVDHGWLFPPTADISTLKLLPATFDDAPQMYETRLPDTYKVEPHWDETKILRQILHPDLRFSVNFMRRTGTPFKVELREMGEGWSVAERLEEEKERRMIRRTQALALYDPGDVFIVLRSRVDNPPLDLVPCDSFKKGRLVLGYVFDTDYKKQ